METREYAFDVKLFAMIRVRATSEKTASGIVATFLKNAELVCECGQAAVVEAKLSLDEDEAMELIEIDDELTG